MPESRFRGLIGLLRAGVRTLNPAFTPATKCGYHFRPCRERYFSMRWLIPILAIFAASPSFAASAVVRDGGTIDIGEVTYRLAGIEAPAVDQVCIDDHADSWACGVDARDQLAKLVGGRDVRCDDFGPDSTYKKWRVGTCTVEGETTSLSQLLVRQGFALSQESSAQGRFREDEADAKDKRRGLWKGCFVAPAEFRGWQKDAPCSAAPAGATRTAKYVRCCFPTNRRCRRAAA